MKTITQTNLNVDTLKSTINWVGSKLIGKHVGTVTLKSANLTVEDNAIVSGAFEMDMRSITCTDLEDTTYNEMLVNHLKSADFFNTAEFPVAAFSIGTVVTKSNGDADIKGVLTIKGISGEIEFPVLLKEETDAYLVSAKMVVDRTKFDVKYASGNFFSNLGDKMIKDEFEINLVLVAKK